MTSITSPRPRPKPLVGVSLKMYFSPSQTKSYLHSLLPLSTLASSLQIDLFVIPDFLSLSLATTLFPPTSSSPLSVGAQDCHWEHSGAYTGEVSAKHLGELGVKMVELGHAERRRLFGETDESVALKAKAVVEAGLVPLVCIGEKEDQGVDAAVEECRPQIESLLASIGGDAEVILAYEPVWAIGKAEPAGAEYVVSVTKRLRAMAESCGVEGGEGRKRKGGVRVIYGGSAGPGLFGKLREGVDGLFLGRFGHDVGNLERVMKELVE